MVLGLRPSLPGEDCTRTSREMTSSIYNVFHRSACANVPGRGNSVSFVTFHLRFDILSFNDKRVVVINNTIIACKMQNSIADM